MYSEDQFGKSGRSHRGGHGEGYSVLVQEPGSHLLFIGSYACTRHKGTERLQLQRDGKLTFLCLQEINWITGDYNEVIEEAARTVAQKYSVKKLILFGGCQLELLNVDFPMITAGLTKELGIPVEFHKGCHLIGYGEEDE
jgi:hypothetical protein